MKENFRSDAYILIFDFAAEDVTIEYDGNNEKLQILDFINI